MPEQLTPHLSLPLPHPDNSLAQDVVRIRDALTALDQKIAALDRLLSSDDMTLDQLQELVGAIKTSRTDITNLNVKIDAQNIAVNAQLTAQNNAINAQLLAQSNTFNSQLNAFNSQLLTQSNTINAQLAAQNSAVSQQLSALLNLAYAGL